MHLVADGKPAGEDQQLQVLGYFFVALSRCR